MRIQKNESGVVLIAVVVFILVASIMVLGMLSSSTSQTLSVEKQVRHIQAEELSRGAFWRAHGNLMSGDTLSGFNQTIDGVNFAITYSNVGNKYSSSVAY